MVTGATQPLPISLAGLRVAITAGAGGIGKIMADSFASAGAKVYICDVNDAALAGCGHAGMRADAGQVREMDAFMDAALAHLSGLDVLVNNAGIAGPTKRVEDIAPAELDETLRIDLASFFHCARRAVPALRASGGGSIVNLSSAAGRFGFALRSPYSAAKWRRRLHEESGRRTRRGRHPRQCTAARTGGRRAHPRRDPRQGGGIGRF